MIRFGNYRVRRFISGMWQVVNGRTIVDTHATLSTAVMQAITLADA